MKLKRLVSVGLAIGILALALAACGEAEDTAKCSDIVKYALDKVKTTKIDTSINFDEETFENNFEKLYNFPISEASDGGISYAAQGGYADEISIIKAKKSDKVTEIRKYLEARLDQRKQDFQGYDPKEVSKIENSKVFVSGQYVVLIIADDVTDMENAIKEGISNS